MFFFFLYILLFIEKDHSAIVLEPQARGASDCHGARSHQNSLQRIFSAIRCLVNCRRMGFARCTLAHPHAISSRSSCPSGKLPFHHPVYLSLFQSIPLLSPIFNVSNYLLMYRFQSSSCTRACQKNVVVGTELDAMDFQGKWFEAVVVAITSHYVQVRYLQWPDPKYVVIDCCTYMIVCA